MEYLSYHFSITQKNHNPLKFHRVANILLPSYFDKLELNLYLRGIFYTHYQRIDRL